MAANTKENREHVANEMVEECKHYPVIRAYVAKILANQMVEELNSPDVKRHVVQVLDKAWDADDDEWNYAADELMGQIHGEPFDARMQDDEQDLDDDGIPMPRPLPFPNNWPPASECEECGGMGYTIGFNGPQKIRYACETCAGSSK